MACTGYRERCLVVSACAALALGGCVYYNTFFNAKRAYEEAERARTERELLRQRTETVRNTDLSSPSSLQPSSSSPQQGALQSTGSGEQQYRAAIEKSAKVLAYYPRSAYVDDALLLMAKSYYRLDEFTASLRKCNELLTSFPNSPLASEARYWRGMMLWKLDQREEATLELRRIADDDSSPFRGDAAFAVAGMERHRGALDEAIRYYRIAVSNAQDPLFQREARKALGECLVEASRPGEAVSFYRELASASWATRDRYAAYVKMAAGQRMMGDHDGALATLRPLLTDQRYDEFVQRTRIEIGRTYEEKGEIEAAVLLYREVLDEAERQNPAPAQGTVSTQSPGTEQRPTVPQTPETVEANYRLGLLHEKHYHNYAKAAEHYAFSAQNQTLDAGRTAKERQGHLSRWNELHAALADTADSTKARARDLTLYTLAEHFLLNLEEPDSAFAYFHAVVDSFPESRQTAKARYAIGWLWLNVRRDTARADSAWAPVLADTTNTMLIRALQQDIRKWLSVEQPDPAEPLYREAETAWLVALEQASPHLPDSLAADSLGRARWWDRWAEEHCLLSERYVPKFRKVIEEYPESPYATRSRFVLGWTTENVMGDTAAAGAWYREASRDTLLLPEVAQWATKVLDLRAEQARRSPAQRDSLDQRTGGKNTSATPDSLTAPSPRRDEGPN